MQAMQNVLRDALAATLSGLSPLDRLGAAWPVVAGHAIAERSAVTAFSDGIVTVTADTTAWRGQLVVLRQQLRSDLARVSRVPLTDILFLLSAQDVPQRPSGGVRAQHETHGKLK